MILYKAGVVTVKARFAVDLTQHALQYGMGFFETMKMQDGQIPYINRHLERISGSIQPYWPKHNLAANFSLLLERFLLEEPQLKQGPVALKLVIFPLEQEILLFNRPYRYTAERYQKGFRLTFAKDFRNPFDRLTYQKTLNYFSNHRNLKEANERGYDECLFENTEGNLCEGSYTNIFFEKNHLLYTPKLTDGLLPGIMRDVWLDQASAAGKPIIETSLPKDFYLHCDHAYCTNALMGIMPIREIAGIIYPLKPIEIPNNLPTIN